MDRETMKWIALIGFVASIAGFAYAASGRIVTLGGTVTYPHLAPGIIVGLGGILLAIFSDEIKS